MSREKRNMNLKRENPLILDLFKEEKITKQELFP